MVSFKTKIAGYKHDLVVFKNDLKKSEDFKAFLGLLGEIIAFSILGGLTYLAFTPVPLLIKFIGIGCGLWLLQEKLLPIITSILSSITLSKNYK